MGGAVCASTTITLLHFSDYHSHALPFYSEGGNKGGIARAIGFMKRHKREGALVFNGGDMMNKGAPAWSDKYRCAEWPWFNGVVDAMALGNHDVDYGYDDFNRCRASIRYPILSANTAGFEHYRIFTRKGIRIGVFAVAVADFPRPVTNAKFPFTDPVAAVRDVVQALRENEHVDAVVMIGHEHADDDYKLAAAVPGIDLILGSHAHLKRELTLIPGTRTWFISPFQYLTYISVVELTFDQRGAAADLGRRSPRESARRSTGKLTRVTGRLVSVDGTMKPDKRVARRVAAMQRDLERDPAYRDLFVEIARLPRPMEVDELARFTVETMRDVAHADVAMSTVSSFRQPLPSGRIDLETLRAALPYDNEIVVGQVTGKQLEMLLSRAAADAVSDARAFATSAGPIDRARTYTVAVTDYMAKVSTAYRHLFRDVKLTSTGLRVRDEVRKRLGV